MGELIFLGTAHAVANEHHENTHLAVVSGKRTLLIDCVGSPIPRLRKAGINPLQISDILVTHFHPDHVSAVPLLLLNQWLMGRQEPLQIYGLQQTVQKLQTLMELYDWKDWPNFYPTFFHPIADQRMQIVMDDEDFRIYSSPVKHVVPTMGVRVELVRDNRLFAYSCDTEPCQEVIELANSVDVLVHEATGEGNGHTSPAQAGEIAAKSAARELYLIHYPVDSIDYTDWLKQAQERFSGPVYLAEDFMRVNFGE